MSIIGSLLGAAAEHVVSGIAKDVAIEAGATVVDKVGHTIMPKDENGVSLMDTPLVQEDHTVVGVAAGAIIHDIVHHNDAASYNAGVPTLVEGSDDSHTVGSDEIQHLPTNNLQSSGVKLPDQQVQKREEIKTEEVYSIPKFTVK